MNRWKNKVAVITGASAGIGAQIVKQLLDLDLIVVGLARRKEKISELSNNKRLFAIKADITKEEDILNAFKWIRENVGPIHILINNAGIIRITTLVDGNTAMWRELLDTNVIGLCIATREAIKDMRKNNVDGHIVHINSICGHKVINVPYLNVMSATKYAVTALTETLRQELNSIGSKIKISDVSPGITSTSAFEAANVVGVIQAEKKVFDERVTGFPALNPSDIADAVIFVLSTPPHVQVHRLIVKPVGEEI